MEMFRPREIITRSRLWRDAEGAQWLLVFSFTLIQGRLECCGIEMRSFLRDRVPADEANGPSYPAWWDGDFWTFEKMKEPSIVRLQSAWPHPLDTEFEQELESGGAGGEEDCLPIFNEARPGSGEDADFELSDDMTRPRPLRAATLRHLRLANEMAKSRRFVQSFSKNQPHWSVAITEDGTAAWYKKMAIERNATWAPKRRRDGRVAKYSLDDLRHVATIYKDAYTHDIRPTQAVAGALGVTRDQAAKLVMKCRAAGLLGQTRRGVEGIGLAESRHDEGGNDDDTT
jgi:hypothetical protein